MWSAVQARLCSDALQALRVEQEWAANQVHFEEYHQKEEKRKQEEVRPDFAVCCAGVTVRRDYLADRAVPLCSLRARARSCSAAQCPRARARARWSGLPSCRLRSLRSSRSRG
jgi:hypothetical protein